MENRKAEFEKKTRNAREVSHTGIRRNVRKSTKKEMIGEEKKEEKIIKRNNRKRNSDVTKSEKNNVRVTRKPRNDSIKEEISFKKEKLKIIPLRWTSRSWEKYNSF